MVHPSASSQKREACSRSGSPRRDHEDEGKGKNYNVVAKSGLNPRYPGGLV